ncbi:hypothetical protein OC707_01505 ['Opuntia sp.' phytoplasma]|uniref:Uncharacterized protein n=1 Tax=Candidatus Phytoplasma asiaticum TaxID=2763338 RepID=A0AAX3B8I9_9MOLU|nr:MULTISPECIES: hypothetical protein [Phytoplasma]MDO8054125.1 hypothetical protein ['Opuntia sp.' phytoplasma]MDO8057967.1 hypothetical protein ['Opuntia sp.' phytoplasma]UQV27010.1 hypothetical protein H7686_0001410 ['Parthenium hysterophorus' phyllody phytoplasma]
MYLLEENAELRHEINKLKEQIKDDKKSHEATKVELKGKNDRLIEKTKNFKELDEKIKVPEKTYSNTIQPLKKLFSRRYKTKS